MALSKSTHLFAKSMADSDAAVGSVVSVGLDVGGGLGVASGSGGSSVQAHRSRPARVAAAMRRTFTAILPRQRVPRDYPRPGPAGTARIPPVDGYT
jgi:hypothetical protein